MNNIKELIKFKRYKKYDFLLLRVHLIHFTKIEVIKNKIFKWNHYKIHIYNIKLL